MPLYKYKLKQPPPKETESKQNKKMGSALQRDQVQTLVLGQLRFICPALD